MRVRGQPWKPWPDPARRCEVCDRPYMDGESHCRNPLCSSLTRWFEWNFAIAMRSGPLEAAINAYKFQGVTDWALIFGRILAGFLEEEAATFRSFDLITSSPTYLGEGGRAFDHTRLVLEKAAAELSPGSVWPFDLDGQPALVKTGATDSMTGKTYAQRRSIAEEQLRPVLSLPEPQRVAGKSILVYDDVFTDGRTLSEVARVLRTAGAARVCGVSLCRQPWRGPATRTTTTAAQG